VPSAQAHPRQVICYHGLGSAEPVKGDLDLLCRRAWLKRGGDVIADVAFQLQPLGRREMPARRAQASQVLIF
jgi:hypothetical protein